MSLQFDLAIIDADVLAFHSALATREDSFEAAKSALDSRLQRLFDCLPEHKAAILLLTSAVNFRYAEAVTAPYKGNRPSERPEHLDGLKQYMVEQYKALAVEGYEADDLVASLAARYHGHKYLVCSNDKDLRQIPGTFFDPTKMEYDHVTSEEAYHLLWLSVLTGDPSDNIKGLPGIGKAKGGKVLEQAKKEGILYPQAVRDFYLEKGKTIEYMYEQLNLLRMRTDVQWPDYEAHFISEAFFSPFEDESEVNGPDIDL